MMKGHMYYEYGSSDAQRNHLQLLQSPQFKVLNSLTLATSMYKMIRRAKSKEQRTWTSTKF